MEGNGLLSAEALLSARRKRVVTSLGVVEVRALGYAELATLRGGLLDLAALLKKAKAVKEADLESLGPGDLAALANIEKVIVAGCVQPKFGFDATLGPVPADLPPPDQFAVFNAICELAGYSKEAAEKLRPS